ncbi:MAG: plastocyanin/azurin family copper-binding protein [Thermodesulfovibrionales bacterium]|nr:plastocyanin/azurin family copper-binding protein [Thermodesulfovibrionales bacterium]
MKNFRFQISNFKFLLILLTFVISAGAAYAEEKKVHIVEIKDFNYHPHELIIYEGDTVLWINKMPYGHWVISGADMKHDNRYFSPFLLENHKFNFTFDDAVVQDYYCPIHSMQGRITVLKSKTKAKVKTEDKVEEKKEPEKKRRRVKD